MKSRRFIVLSLLFLITVIFSFCNQQSKKISNEPFWRNWSDTAHYVGMNTCKQCHSPIHMTFMHTGMGESFDFATIKKSRAVFDKHAVVYDSKKNFYYKPLWKDSSLYILEFRLNGRDTIYKREEKIEYIIGSGQHTNSHIWNSNGYLYQAPMTFYTQKKIWDLPPGFEDGQNSRWSRTISLECMTCHNMYPEFDVASDNKFVSVKTGIECERCHGPGSIHVAEKLTGMIVDTSKGADRSIVNPRRLSVELQTELCQRCHLQGISVLNEGKTFFDFKPGMKLNDVENIFMPRYEGGNESFIMASHADRMKQSQCFIQSKTMSCLTCHNPHVSVKQTSEELFNSVCMNCHQQQKKLCTEDETKREVVKDNCFSCHMPESETMDIPHVTVHDHKIQIPISKTETESVKHFVGLQCMTTDQPSPILMAQGYLAMYESFTSQPFLLDSANYFLSKEKNQTSTLFRKTEIHYCFLKTDYSSVLKWANEIATKDTLDAWTYYRIGESYLHTGNSIDAEKYFSLALKLKGNVLEFENKLGVALLQNGKQKEAQDLFEKIISQQPKYAPAISNLAYIYLVKNDMVYAEKLVNDALSLDPDYIDALMNKAAILITIGKNSDAKKILHRVLELEPDNQKAIVADRNLN
ncbi:MAG TPA: pilus assembly protein TadD [Bacteroidetes bacterium]|nr:pilus assembly protein TadD [Bacteroidota bacterium]